MQEQVGEVAVADSVKAYILAIASATRSMEEITLGVSPRGSIALYKAAKANAFIFDMDGLIFDTERIFMEILQEIAGKQGYHLTKEMYMNYIIQRTKMTKPILKQQ